MHNDKPPHLTPFPSDEARAYYQNLWGNDLAAVARADLRRVRITAGVAAGVAALLLVGQAVLSGGDPAPTQPDIATVVPDSELLNAGADALGPAAADATTPAGE